MIEFWVPGTPKPQPRQRSFVVREKGGKPAMQDGNPIVRTFDPSTAEGWKAQVVRHGRAFRPDKPLEGPLIVSILFLLERPKRLYRKKDFEGVIWHTSKPDIDNLSKAVLDAMTIDGWWKDDSQICGLELTKKYHAKSGDSGAMISVVEAVEYDD